MTIDIRYFDLSNIMHPEYLEESRRAKRKQRRQHKFKKERARNLAITWQHNLANSNHSLLYYASWYDRFYKIGKKYGLLREFRNNGIL